MKKTLILGFGNYDRQDDGAAWHILAALADKSGWEGPFFPEEGFPLRTGTPDFMFVLQLTPELSEIIANYERVCFIDAHTENLNAEISIRRIDGKYQKSPFTHHLTPESCLAMCEALYRKHPEAILVSVRGYRFGFSHNLSPKTARLISQAVEQTWSWLIDRPKPER